MTAQRPPTSAAVPTSRTTAITAWTLQVLLGLAIVAAGAPKLLAEAGAVETFNDIGVGPWLRPVVGALEIAGAAGLMVPRLRALAALGLLLLLLGATIVNMAVPGRQSAHSRRLRHHGGSHPVPAAA